jgi:hypothetical protein
VDFRNLNSLDFLLDALKNGNLKLENPEVFSGSIMSVSFEHETLLPSDDYFIGFQETSASTHAYGSENSSFRENDSSLHSNNMIRPKKT